MLIKRTTALLLLSLCGACMLPAAFAASGPLLSQLSVSLTPVVSVPRPLPPASQLPARSTALDYATSASVALSTQTHGRWSQSGGKAFWRVILHSENARNLSLTLGEFSLPASATVRLYDGEGYLWQGPYSAATLQRRSRFWTPVVPGDKVLLELSVAQAEQSLSALRVVQLHHGYRSLDTRSKSGSCNVDVACPEADAWSDAVRASARITIGGRRLCSAVLLNNTRQDGDPLLLTADHCGIGEDEDLSADSLVVYWNYQSSQCGGDPDGSLRQNQTGSTLLARGPSADFSLVRLDQTAPLHYQVYYAGWDASGISPSSGVSVHHPSGDEKRISVFRQRANPRVANVDGARVQTWEVFWSRGITEAGSSGSGLWDSAHRVVGQLSGGNSSCSNQDSSDVYGRLDVAWQESNTISGQLKAWLDPDNTNQIRLDGLDSSNDSLNANPDVFTRLPEDRRQLRLDVLANDAGARPLRLISASARHGQVRVENTHLVYDFASLQPTDQISYQIVDRWGDTATSRVDLEQDFKALDTRGGALGWWCLLLGLLRFPRWRRG